jgi:large repetitive protein
VREIRLRRTPAAGAAVATTESINLVVAGESLLEREIVLASPADTAGGGSFTFEAVQSTDEGGSRAIYRLVLAAPAAETPGLMVTVLPRQVPLAGGLTDFDVTLFNNGYAEMDVILSRNSGAAPGDLSVVVLDGSGQEVSRTPFQGTISGAIFGGGGISFIRIAPGAFRSVPVTGVLVPEALGSGGSAGFRAEVAAIYHDAGTAAQKLSGPLFGVNSSALRQTDYYGVATANADAYYNEQKAIITGQAISRATGLPAPFAPLKLGFTARGAAWFEEVVTDEQGNFAFEYEPSLGLAGQFKIWAAHPEVFDQLNQDEFRFFRLYSAPARGSVRMSKNDSLEFDLLVVNAGDESLDGVAVTAEAFVVDGENLTPISTLSGGLARPASGLPANRRQPVRLRLQAAPDAPNHALVVFTIGTSSGASTTFTAEVTLLAAQPALVLVNPRNGFVEASLDRGGLFSREVTIENRGLRALEGIEITPPASKPWMQVNLPVSPDGKIRLPNLEPGQTATFGVVFAPPASVEQGFHTGQLVITGSNAPTEYKINLFARVTSSAIGSVQFAIDNLLVQPVPNASVLLRNQTLGIDKGPFFTDAEGNLQVDQLVEGDWAWRISAPGHTGLSGVVTVVADQVVGVEARLHRSLVTVRFSVVPVPFTDRYEIKIEQTFQTRVPVPVMVLTPQSVTLTEIEPGFTGTVMFTLKNEGLISVFDVELFGKRINDAIATPLIDYLPELKPQQSVQIPMRIEYFGGTAEPSVQAGVFSGSPGVLMAASAPPTMDGVGDFIDCFRNFKYGDITLTMFGRGSAQCPDGAAYYPGASATINVDKLLKYACRFGKKVKVIKAACIASNIIKGLACALAQLPPATLTGKPLPGFGSSGGGVTGYGGGGSWPTSAADACLLPGTRVSMADGSTKPIEEIDIGDRLFSADAPAGRLVLSTTRLQAREVLLVQTKPLFGDGETRELGITPEHRVWLDQSGWTFAGDLQPGQWMRGQAGELREIVSVERIDDPGFVYTLQLEADSAFYAEGLLLHDQCGGEADLDMADAFISSEDLL